MIIMRQCLAAGSSLQPKTQDAAWREQQRRLLSAQFGPREVESLAMNAVLPLEAEREPGFAGAPLRWVQERELKELAVLRGQSAHSSWFFIESARIGDVNANVTIVLTSSILAARHGGSAPPEHSGGGLFRRLIGALGFQLINVNNVPLSLRGWSVDTRLIGRKALTNSLTRHYFAQALSEAHKVCVGVGGVCPCCPAAERSPSDSHKPCTTGAGRRRAGDCGGAADGGVGGRQLRHAGHQPGRRARGPAGRGAARRLRLLHEPGAGGGQLLAHRPLLPHAGAAQPERHLQRHGRAEPRGAAPRQRL
jgi:hypothetical protein